MRRKNNYLYVTESKRDRQAKMKEADHRLTMWQIYGRLTDDRIRKRDCMMNRKAVQASG